MDGEVTAGQIAALIAAGAFAVVALALAWLLVRLRRTVDAATVAITELTAQAEPILRKADLTMENVNTALTQAHTSLDSVNLQLQKVDAITAHAAQVSANVANLSTVIASVAANPLIKVAALGYGMRRAVARRARLEEEREVRQTLRERMGPPAAAWLINTEPGEKDRIMRRLLWLGIGLAVGALVVRAVSRKAQSYSPSGIAAAVRDSSVHLLDSVRDFVDEVREGMHERQQELQAAIAEGELIGEEFIDPEQPGTGLGRSGAQQPSPMRTPPEDTSRSRTAEIKRRFLAHFEADGHAVVASAPLPAVDDPNLLFVNAGMVQFVPYFLGQRDPAVPPRSACRNAAHPGHRRGRQDQPARHVLPDERQLLVRGLLQGGRDHLRLGAGDRAGGAGGLGIDPDRIWVTVYQDDEEADEHLAASVGLPPERIVRRGKADNFWSHGHPGPCGPCSEIYFDRGPEYGPEGGPAVDEDRYLEIWNLVFMQYERGPRHQQGGLPDPRASCRPRTSTPAWAWSGWPRCCRASTTCTRSTRCARSWTGPPS